MSAGKSDGDGENLDGDGIARRELLTGAWRKPPPPPPPVRPPGAVVPARFNALPAR